MALTPDQVLALAPDAQVASAGRKLAAASHWKSPGRSDVALWGECQGSALYQVRVDLADLSAKCSCPSRKFPCKHAMGLLLLHADRPLAVGPAPAWVSEWLARRAEKATAKQEKAAKPADDAVADPAAQQRRAKQRERRVDDGIAQLELWACDILRRGAASLESEGAAFWEKQAQRMVDAQAPGLAARLRRLADVPGSGPAWPGRVIEELGSMVLLAHAWRRIDELPAPLQSDVRRALGFSESLEDVARDGESVTDAWDVIAQATDEAERVRVQRTWLLGARTRRAALVLQFAPGRVPFPALVMPGTRIDADLAFFPGAFAQRALIKERRGVPSALDALAGDDSIDSFLGGVSEALAQQPWIDRFPCALRDVTPACDARGDGWHVVDRAGHALSVATGRTTRPWKLLALWGGSPVHVAGEWDGRALLPLGVVAGGTYHVIREEAT